MEDDTLNDAARHPSEKKIEKSRNDTRWPLPGDSIRDLFGMVIRDPFRWLSDLQLGDQKVTLNHLDMTFSVFFLETWVTSLAKKTRNRPFGDPKKCLAMPKTEKDASKIPKITCS